jgi:[CysO sulfur-carrier protein]-S-L-cysteine hydrolase
MPGTIRVRSEILTALWEQARVDALRECCGLLAGRDGVITRAFAATNAASDTAKTYEIAPAELFGLMREIRAAGLELLGIYHSHPAGDNLPSSRDVERAYYPEAVYFIVSPRGGVPQPVRAFSIHEGRVSELQIQSDQGLAR